MAGANGQTETHGRGHGRDTWEGAWHGRSKWAGTHEIVTIEIGRMNVVLFFGAESKQSVA